MLKREMAETISTALHPAHYRLDSPAIQGHIEHLMKSSSKELRAYMYMANRVHTQREGEK